MTRTEQSSPRLVKQSGAKLIAFSCLEQSGISLLRRGHRSLSHSAKVPAQNKRSVMYLNILPRPGATVQQQIGTGTGYKTRGKFFWKEEDFYRYGGKKKKKRKVPERSDYRGNETNFQIARYGPLQLYNVYLRRSQCLIRRTIGFNSCNCPQGCTLRTERDFPRSKEQVVASEGKAQLTRGMLTWIRTKNSQQAGKKRKESHTLVYQQAFHITKVRQRWCETHLGLLLMISFELFPFLKNHC